MLEIIIILILITAIICTQDFDRRPIKLFRPLKEKEDKFDWDNPEACVQWKIGKKQMTDMKAHSRQMSKLVNLNYVL